MFERCLTERPSAVAGFVHLFLSSESPVSPSEFGPVSYNNNSHAGIFPGYKIPRNENPESRNKERTRVLLAIDPILKKPCFLLRHFKPWRLRQEADATVPVAAIVNCLESRKECYDQLNT